VEDFEKALSRFRSGLLVQFEMGWGEEDVRRTYQGKALDLLHQDDAYVEKMTEMMRVMSSILCKLEKEALYMGYRFATALSGGCCRLCDECVGPAP
jgi:predicted metal-binding protein